MDEVGDIPLAQQAKILRVLQDGEITPVGDVRPTKVDIRIIQTLLGHRKIETTTRYTQVANSILQEVTSPLDTLNPTTQ